MKPSFTRSWRDVTSTQRGEQWIGKLPVLNVDDYVFAFANIIYDSTIVRSTDFNAAIPSKLGSAKATDNPSDNLSSNGYDGWTNIAELEGRKGIKGFRSTNNQRGSGTEQLSDPKWRAPEKSSLSFKFYCTEANRIRSAMQSQANQRASIQNQLQNQSQTQQSGKGSSQKGKGKSGK